MIRRLCPHVVLFPGAQWRRFQVPKATWNSDEVYRFYSRLSDRLTESFGDGALRLKGVDFGIKEMTFERTIIADCILAAVGFLLVVLSVFLYCKSVVFTLVIAIGMTLSTTTAYFVYTVRMFGANDGISSRNGCLGQKCLTRQAV